MIALQILGTYAVVSFGIGCILMIYDTIGGFDTGAGKWVTAFYLPPLGLVGLGLVITIISAIWH